MLNTMLNPTLVLFGDQIGYVKAEIEGIEQHITSIEEAGAREHLSREVALLRGVRERYRDLLAALEAAANSLSMSIDQKGGF
jgi:hypothetical protein